MSIHVDGSTGGGIGAWPEIDISPLRDAPGVVPPTRVDAACTQPVARRLSNRGRPTPRRQMGSGNCGNCGNPCHGRRGYRGRGSGNCANCPIPLGSQNARPYGTQETNFRSPRSVHAQCCVALLPPLPASPASRERWPEALEGVAGIAEIGVSPKGCTVRHRPGRCADAAALPETPFCSWSKPWPS